jgi:hypothetical protein
MLACALSACRDKVPEPPASTTQVASAKKPLLVALPPGKPNDWIESNRYRFRVLEARPCNEGSNGRYRLGVAVEIEAKPGSDVAKVFASPKGAELEKNGNVFRPRAEPTPGCEPLLEPTSLAPGQSVRGMLVFDAPEISYVRSAVLRFKPPRWGFESRVSVQLPDCFGSNCAGADGPRAEGMKR